MDNSHNNYSYHTCVKYLKDPDIKFKDNTQEISKILYKIFEYLKNNAEPNSSNSTNELVVPEHWISFPPNGVNASCINEAWNSIFDRIAKTFAVTYSSIMDRYSGKGFTTFVYLSKSYANSLRDNLLDPKVDRELTLNEKIEKYKKSHKNLYTYLSLVLPKNYIDIEKNSDIFANDIVLDSTFDVIDLCQKAVFEFEFYNTVFYSLHNEFKTNKVDFKEISEFLQKFLESDLYKSLVGFLKFSYPFPSKESFTDRLPKNVKKLYNSSVYNTIAIEFLKIKNKVDESDYIDFYEDNFFSLLTNNSSYFNSTVSTSRYLDAVRFYTLISGGASYTSAFCTIFKSRAEATRQEIIRSDPELEPEQVQKIFNDRISSKASAYAKGKLVSEVLSRDILPNSLRYYDARHKALNTLIDICSDESNTPKNRIEASNYILTHTNNLVKQDNQADFTEETRTTFLQSFINDLEKIGKIQKYLIDNNQITVEDASKQSLYGSEDE